MFRLYLRKLALNRRLIVWRRVLLVAKRSVHRRFGCRRVSCNRRRLMSWLRALTLLGRLSRIVRLFVRVIAMVVVRRRLFMIRIRRRVLLTRRLVLTVTLVVLVIWSRLVVIWYPLSRLVKMCKVR